MKLHLAEAPDYSGEAGINHIRELQLEMEVAVAEDDWHKIRRLDKACELAIDRVIHASRGDTQALKSALHELKGVYSQLIMKCKCDEQAIAI